MTLNPFGHQQNPPYVKPSVPLAEINNNPSNAERQESADHYGDKDRSAISAARTADETGQVTLVLHRE
jgi:hypothetical protein